MSGPVQRPEFYENQVLGAADLAEMVRYARNQMARHEMWLHEWGIVAGLDLKLDSATGDLLVAPGAAIDGFGREIVVPDQLSVPFVDFTISSAGAKPTDWFPVFLVGKDLEQPATTTLTGLCAQSQPTRISESSQVEFGNLGDEQTLADQTPPSDLTGDPDGAVGDASPWRILLGYVQVAGKFTATDAGPAGMLPRRYAGVLADDVSARGTQLTLGTSRGGQGKPQITISEKDGGGFEFRLVGAKDPPLLSVNANGDLSITGKFTATGQQPGSVLVQSGTVSDGALLPLPQGITQQMVQKGDVTLHVQLTPHVLPSAMPTGATIPLFASSECLAEVDPTDQQLRVRCSVKWFKDVTTLLPVAAACDYLVMAVFPPTVTP